MRARFDDLTPGSHRSFEFEDSAGTIVAHLPADVAPALEAVEEAVAEGLWAAGFVAYEAAAGLDPALTVVARDPADPLADLPLLCFGVFRERAEVSSLADSPAEGARYDLSGWASAIDRTAYGDAVARIRRHIEAGDTYQVNFTFRLRAAFGGEPSLLYRDLALAQGGAYNALLDMGRYHVACATPELFFRIDGDHLTTRPMKGTARRGRWSEEDRAAAAALAASEKEQAENLMIVDLIRNDLGRIAEFGTVEVERLFEVERYPTVWQLTSTVGGRLAPGVSLEEVFRALFPCGSVTGAPKARTMEIITALESEPRGAYCGAVGYLAPPGVPGPRARFGVAIRTVTIDGDEGLAEYGVGGGITWGSSPVGEFGEAWAKALVLTERHPSVGLLETLRFEPGSGYAWPQRHLDRMQASAEYFDISFDRSAAETTLAVVADGLDAPCRVRLRCDALGGLSASVAELPPVAVEPARVVVDAEPISSQNRLLFHKTTQRREYDRRAERHPDADEVLLVNERGEVTEATTANLVVRLQGRWYTPPLESGCLPGIYRQVLLEEGEVAEAVISLDTLRRAEAVALVNSVRLWRPAVLASLTPSIHSPH